MGKAWFDTHHGEVLDNSIVARQRMKEVGAAVIPLASLVRGEEFPYRTGDYALLNTRDWTTEQFITFGRTALKLLTDPGEPRQTVKREHFERLRVLGIGPPPTQIIKRVGSFNTFKAAIGAPTEGDLTRFRGLSVGITREEVIEKVGRLADRLEGRVTWPEYRKAKSKGLVPSDQTVLKMFGGLTELNDMLGYPNVKDWDRENFIDFGLRFLDTNGVDKFTSTGFIVLSKRDRGPWTKNIGQRFGSWSSYKQEVLAAWETHQQQKAARVVQYRKDITAGRLPNAFKDLDDTELLQRTARYRVATECIPHATEAWLTDASELLALGSFSRRLKTYSAHINDGYVEMVAMSRGILDDMWPQTDARIYVSDEEIETERALRRASRKPALLQEPHLAA